MRAFISTVGRVTLRELGRMNGRQLAELHNELAERPVKKFRDRSTALARVTPLVEDRLRGVPVRRRKVFNLPGLKTRRPHRRGTKRAILVLLLTRPGGATFEQCMAVTGWPYKTCYDILVSLNEYNGFEIRETKGRIRLID